MKLLDSIPRLPIIIPLRMDLAAFLISLFLFASAAPAPAQAESYTLQFSTYIGGSDWEHARDIVADAQGNLYVVGGTHSPDYPTTPGAFCRTYNGGNCDGFVSKFSPEGKLLWSTLIGGPGYDRIYGVKVDAQGCVYVCGRGGPGFPTTTGAFQPNFQGSDNGLYGMQNGFVAKLSADGAKVLWASYVGTGQLCRDLTLSPEGEIYVSMGTTGRTKALPPAEWFTHAYQKTPRGGIDSAVVKVASDGARVEWATWLGGPGNESQEVSVRLDAAKNVLLVCNTNSPGLPLTPPGVARPYAGGEDCYVAKLTPDGSQMIYGTYLGGAKDEWTVGTHQLAVDPEGNAYVATSTASPDFPTTPATLREKLSGPTDIAIVKLSPRGEIVKSTLLGGSAREGTESISVDARGCVYFAGETASPDFPVTAGAWQKTFGGNHDVVVVRLAADFSRLLYSSFLGGAAYENGRASCFGPDGSLCLAGAADGPGWPLKNPFQARFAGGSLPPNLSFGSGDVIVARFAPVK